MNQITEARAGNITQEMACVTRIEDIDQIVLRDHIARGEVTIFRSTKNATPKRIVAVGKGLSTKINANIGTSRDLNDLAFEIEKLRIAEHYGADTVMDLSTGGDVRENRKKIIDLSVIPVGTVPVYDVMFEMSSAGKKITDVSDDDFLRAIEDHIEDGVDFITVHCGVTEEVLRIVQASERLMGVVSRGGSFICNWMQQNRRENPLYRRFDDIVALAKKYDVVLSLGDGLRPGALHDASDEAQFKELMILGELQQRALQHDVQVIIEGPGHVPLDQIEMNMKLQKKTCHNAPFYVLGPLVTDIAPGYDHITAAIGGALAAWSGADYLCYVTPAEHLKLPDLKDVKEGVIATKIAAHAADIAKYGVKYRRRDDEFSKSRMQRDWESQIKHGLDPEKAKAYRDAARVKENDTCSMCGEFCSAKLNEQFLKK
ncbi:MAG: phosphomethylpyrimidine synthase ThiC [Candidatus Omnitrophica bacterium]|nr:phosphomethylpyrimidine synthase ThiC [Candidatus Omnitrophota bacterium]